MSYQEFLAYMAQYEEDAYQSIYTGAQIDEGVGKALYSKNVAALEYETVAAGGIRLKNASWDTSGIYDFNQAKTQAVINGKLADVFDAANATGSSVATLIAPDVLPVKGAIVNLSIVQSGSGDPSPSNIRSFSGWTGCNITQTGKNLGNFIDGKGINSGGNISNTSGRCATVDPIKIDPTKVYTVSHQSSSGRLFICAVWNGSTLVRRTANIESGEILDTSGGTHMYLCLYAGGVSVTVAADMPMVEIGEAASSYAPYIGDKQEISWLTEAGTVYAGAFNITSGMLSVYSYYAAYNGETLVGPWISDRDVYAVGTSPTIGAQVIDFGGTETFYQLTPHGIKTLSGQNNFWADCGDISVRYGAYLAAQTKYSDIILYELMAQIAPVENGDTASQAYAAGKYFFRKGIFCKAKGNGISQGGAFTLNTNYEQTTIAAELYAALQ